MGDQSLEILVLSGDEELLGFLDPDLVTITESNSYSGLKQITISHPIEDESTHDYDSLLIQGRKIWRNETQDGPGCLYIINSEKESDEDTVYIPAEEVLVELNVCGVVERTSSSPITINEANLTTWFGQYFTIGTFEAPLGKTAIAWTGTLTRMALLRQIEEETLNVFVTRYEKDLESNIIHRYLDFKQSIGVEHTIPLELGENTDKIILNINEDDTYRSIVPLIKESESSGATTDTVKTSQVMADYKALAVNVGDSIPMIIEKKQDGTEVVSAYWNAPFKKDAGSYEVYLASGQISSSYNNIYFKESPDGGLGTAYQRKQGTVETSETNKYVIYNLCALKLMDKKDPVIEIQAEINDLIDLPGGDTPFNVGDIIHIRLPGRDLISSRVEKTEKNPRNIGQSKITIGNSVSRTSASRSDINRPAGLDTITLSQIYGEISDVSESIPGVADGRINSLCPGIANTRIDAMAPDIADTRINALAPGIVSNKLSESIIFNGSGTTTAVTISNLNGATQKVYTLQGRYQIVACTSIPHIYMQINGDTGTNYDNEVLKVIDGVVTGFSADNEVYVRLEHGLVSANPVIFWFDITVLNGVGGYQAVNAHITVRDTTTLSTKLFTISSIRKVSENINSIRIGVSGGVTDCNYNFKVTTPPIP